MSALEIVFVLAAGFAAGTINALIGSGTLITFPVLLAVGYPPIVANVSNSLGLVPGAASAAVAYRRELSGSRARLLRLAPATIAGSVVGAILLLTLPESSFERIVPILIVLSLVLIVCQPRISAWLAARREAHRPHGGPWLLGGIFGTGVYGGYFGAGQGILLLAELAIALPGELRELNAIRAVLAGIANGVAGLVFIFAADVAYLPVLLIAVGSTAGGLFGAGIGRRLPDHVLRGVIVVVGVAAILQLVF
ncbi:MAG: sulfite exporter TauE/SafE family protein [Solirubrobacterales bacterium]|nr:sulfite exporter TauE/SafE family protein [Solirubrobacterales bacterium]